MFGCSGEGEPVVCLLNKSVGVYRTGPESRRTFEVDPDFLEHCRREETEQLELPLGY